MGPELEREINQKTGLRTRRPLVSSVAMVLATIGKECSLASGLISNRGLITPRLGGEYVAGDRMHTTTYFDEDKCAHVWK